MRSKYISYKVIRSLSTSVLPKMSFRSNLNMMKGSNNSSRHKRSKFNDPYLPYDDFDAPLPPPEPSEIILMAIDVELHDCMEQELKILELASKSELTSNAVWHDKLTQSFDKVMERKTVLQGKKDKILDLLREEMVLDINN